MELGLEEKICVITGSTAGIGLEVARQLQCEGAHVVTSGRREDGVGDLHVAADLSRAGEPGRLIAETINRFGRVDCLINNVGGTDIRTLDELTDDDWQSSFEINLMSAIRATQAALPGMCDRKSGVIVNVSSSAGKRPSPSMPDYSVMKAGLLSYSRLVADLYAKDGVRCNAVAPGPTATGAWLDEGGLADQQAARTNNTRLEVVEAVGKGRPLGRLAEPEEIASVICFLCSERSSYVTGSAWSADGGTVPIII